MLFVVLAAAAIATTSLTTSIRLAFMRQSHERTQHWRLQADWLAISGVERARAKLAADREYAGETWHALANMVANAGGGVVRISVSDDDIKVKKVVVESRFPDLENGAKATRECRIRMQ